MNYGLKHKTQAVAVQPDDTPIPSSKSLFDTHMSVLCSPPRASLCYYVANLESPANADHTQEWAWCGTSSSVQHVFTRTCATKQPWSRHRCCSRVHPGPLLNLRCIDWQDTAPTQVLDIDPHINIISHCQSISILAVITSYCAAAFWIQ